MVTDPKKWFQSKKFLAAMGFTIVWVVLLIVALFEMKEDPGYALTITVMALCLGFVQVLYLGGQAAVDTFLQMALAVTGVFGKRNTPDTDPAGTVSTDLESQTDPRIGEAPE